MMRDRSGGVSRANGILTLTLGLVAILLASGVAGVGAQAAPLSVEFEWPNEGETLYAGPSSLLYNVPIRGLARSEVLALEGLEVRLEVIRGSTVVGSLVDTLDLEGRFELHITVNPQHSIGQFNRTDGQFAPELLACGACCHFPTEAALPAGPATLQVTVVGPQGESATAERHIVIDRSDYAQIPVRVVLESDPEQGIENINVQGEARLYLWRARHVSAATDQDGLALVSAEALSEAPTRYVFRVVPTVVNGILYQGLGPVSVELPPAATSVPPITLTAEARAGAIRGRVSLPLTAAVDSPSLLAIQLPAGRAHPIQVQADGSFELRPLPIDDYLVTLDSSAVPRDRFTSPGQVVDLTQVHEAELDMAVFAAEGNTVTGQIIDSVEGTPLPFAWVALQNSTRWQPTSPADGTFLLTDLPEQPPPLLVGAPGYYSQVQGIEASFLAGEVAAIGLERQDGTLGRPWGGGEVVIPVDSQTSGDGFLRLDRGWLWGRGGDRPLALRVGSTDITLSGGAFALEYLPGRRGWLYLLAGRAQLSRPDLETGVTLEAGQMINLLNPEGLVPVSFRPAVIDALQPTEGPPLSYVWQPTLKALLQGRLAEIGIGAAQLLTLATYLAVVSSAVVVPAALLVRWRRRKLAATPAKKS